MYTNDVIASVDVSIVLNIHQENDLLIPTLTSLNRCALYAKKLDISVELIAVFDNSDKSTNDKFSEISFSGFNQIKKIEVSFGSLGLARNAGINASIGKYIWTADADDLVSENCIVALNDIAEQHQNEEVAIFSEYYVAFGDNYYVAKFFDSSFVCAADFAYQHSYVSRVFAKKELFLKFPYKDTKLSQGNAYEDWDFNARLYNAGVHFLIAPATIIFYRQHSKSIMKQADIVSYCITPHSELFDCNNLINKMADFNQKINDSYNFFDSREKFFKIDFVKEILNFPNLVKYIDDASCQDPLINLFQIERASSYCPLPWNRNHWGFSLISFYSMMGCHSFESILLIDNNENLQLLSSIYNMNQYDQLIIYIGKDCNEEFIDSLPDKVIFIDLYHSFQNLSINESQHMLLRAFLALTYTKKIKLYYQQTEQINFFVDKYHSLLFNNFDIVKISNDLEPKFCFSTEKFNNKINIVRTYQKLIASKGTELEQAKTELEQTKYELKIILLSKSWQITKPLRFITQKLKLLLKRLIKK